MIEVTVSREFRDKDNFTKVYKVGDVVSFEDERAKKLVALDLVKIKSASKAKDDKESKQVKID